MNRAWIPAGALAGVSVAGLLALGPLTDSLQHARVVPVRRDRVRSRRRRAASVPVSVTGGVVGSHDAHAALTARRAASRAPDEQRHGLRRGEDLAEAAARGAVDPRRRRSHARQPTPAKKKTAKPRPTSIGGSSESNGDEGLASGGSGSGAAAAASSQPTPGSRHQLPETCRQPGPCWYDSGPRGYSSVGRAPGSHPGGQRFEPA